MPVEPRLLDRRLAALLADYILSSGLDLRALSMLLKQLEDQRRHAGRQPIAHLAEAARFFAGIAALDDLLGSVAGRVDATQASDSSDLGASCVVMLTTEQLAEREGVGSAAIAKRARTGVYPNAARAGRSWLIPVTDVLDEGSA